MRLLKILLVGLLVVGGVACPAWATIDDAVMNAQNADDPQLAKQAAAELGSYVSESMSLDDYNKVLAALQDLYDRFGGDANVLAEIRKSADKMQAVSGAIPGATTPGSHLTTPPGQTLTGGPGQGGNPPGASGGQGGGGGKPASPK